MPYNFVDATVVVPAYNAAATIAACIEGLLAQQAVRLDIVVVDDGSNDATAAIVARFAGVRLIIGPHAGAAAARNAGIATTPPSVEFILFTDADCVPAPDWAAQLIAALRQADSEVVGVKGIYKTRQPQLVARFAQVEYEQRYRRFARAEADLDFADTYSAGFRRSVLAEFPFEVSLPGAIVEDAELGWRLRQAGYTFKFQPQAIVYHQHLTSGWGYFRRKFRIAAWRVVLYRTYPDRLPTDSHTSQAAKLQMLLMAMALPLLMLRPTRWLGKIVLLMLELSYLSFVRRVWQTDRAVVVAALPMLHLRTLAQISGAIVGLIKLKNKKVTAQTTHKVTTR